MSFQSLRNRDEWRFWISRNSNQKFSLNELRNFYRKCSYFSKKIVSIGSHVDIPSGIRCHISSARCLRRIKSLEILSLNLTPYPIVYYRLRHVKVWSELGTILSITGELYKQLEASLGNSGAETCWVIAERISQPPLRGMWSGKATPSTQESLLESLVRSTWSYCSTVRRK